MSDSRAQILSQALVLFAARGYDAVGVQQVVEAAGLTKPTLYHYFGSKKGLFEALVEERSGPLLEAVRVGAANQGDITLTVTRLTSTYFRFALAEPDFYRLLLAAWFAPPSSDTGPAVRGVQERQHRLIAEMFRLASRDHGNMRGRHERYALTLRGMIDTYIGLWLQGGCDLTDHAILFDAVHQFMHGIFS
ncbi:MAG: TetR/AcrR family transcriptional regulator [Pseudomonadota bacterium]